MKGETVFQVSCLNSQSCKLISITVFWKMYCLSAGHCSVMLISHISLKKLV